MQPLRQQFHEQLAEVEDAVLQLGHRAEELVGNAMEALRTGDEEQASAVVRTDDDIDRERWRIEEQIHRLLALQAPVARDLRLITALLHCNLHVERIGDYAVNVARSVRHVGGTHGDAELAEQIQEMGQLARQAVAVAIGAFGKRDAEAASSLPALDDPLDQLNRGIFRRLVQLASSDDSLLDWAMWMVLVSRFLERIGDHAVDIGQQALYVVTGRAIDA